MFIAFCVIGLVLQDDTVAEGDESSAVDLPVGRLRIEKILFLGNSSTFHPPRDEVDWQGNWGMAASAADKDYVHLLVTKLGQELGGTQQLMAKNIADFERRVLIG